VAKLTRLTHKIAIQLQVVAESCTPLLAASPETFGCTLVRGRDHVIAHFHIIVVYTWPGRKIIMIIMPQLGFESRPSEPSGFLSEKCSV
jgi:hypothetical protein